MEALLTSHGTGGGENHQLLLLSDFAQQPNVYNRRRVALLLAAHPLDAGFTSYLYVTGSLWDSALFFLVVGIALFTVLLLPLGIFSHLPPYPRPPF